MKKIFIADTTLCASQSDAERELSFKEKLDIAKRLESAGVDAVEFGTPSGSKEDEVILKTISSVLKSTMISVCGGDDHESITRAAECVKNAAISCIRIELPISTVQMEYTYHYKEAKMIDLIKDLCGFASSVSDKVEFVAKDASRADAAFTEKCCVAAFESGAYAVTLCDDSGDYFPDEFAQLVNRVKAVCDAKLYVAPTNKLSMATANAVAAIAAGADGLKTSSASDVIPSVEVIAEVIRARGDMLQIESGINITAVHNIMSEVSADVASQAADTYPQADDEITLGANLTLSDVTSAVESLGYILDDQDYGKVFDSCKRLIVKKKVIGARELEAVIASSAMQVPSTFHVVSYVINSGNVINATANITLEKDGEQLSGVSVGDGPIDAAFHAIEQIIGHKYELDDFRIQAVTEGREALGSALIRLRADGKLYVGNGISTDIIGACVRAYINALNKIIYEAKR